MGAKNIGLAVKFSLILHSLRLLAENWKIVKWFSGSCHNICTDQGTEKGLTEVPAVNANVMFKTWDESARIIDDQAIPGELPPSLEDALISFQSAIGTPGAEHMLHTICKKVIHCMPLWKWWYRGAKELGKALLGNFYVDRMTQTCFRVRGSDWIREKCENFKWNCTKHALAPLWNGCRMFYR